MFCWKFFKCERLRLDRELLNLDFLVSCRRQDIIPNFLKNRNKFTTKMFSATNHKFERKCLDLCIRNKYAFLDALQKRTFKLHLKVGSTIPRVIFDELNFKLDLFRDLQNTNKMEVQRRKLNRLCKVEGGKPQPQPVPFLNLSSRTLTPEETTVLHLGPKFMFPSKPSLKNIVPELESIVQTTDRQEREEVRNIMFQEVKKLFIKPKVQTASNLKIINDLKNDPTIIIIQTDKSNKIAILNTDDYIDKMKVCINSMMCHEVKRDPITSISKKVEDLVKVGTWPTMMKDQVKVNPLGVTPRITGRLKDHKKDKPLRPIVSKCFGPTYFIEKAYVPFLKSHLPDSVYTVKSTCEFIQRMKTVQLPDNYIMASLDIVSLFPSIDMHEISGKICSEIDMMDEYTDEIKLTLKRGLNLIMHNNYFTFNNKFYQQDEGAPMGSPISSLVAEFKLRPLENHIFETFTLIPHLWLRYVDDIFIIWPFDIDSLHHFFEQLNNIDKNIKFTLEVEVNGSLPFLDVMLIKNNQAIDRTVYRKPMANPLTIPYDAFSPFAYKLSAFKFFVRRAFEVCTDNYLDSELDIIRKIGLNSGFKTQLINKIISGLHSNRNLEHPINLQHSRISTLQYFPGFFERLKYRLQRFNVCLVAKPPPKLKDIVYRKLDPIHPDNYAGVYQIPYTKQGGVQNFYIGKTGRKFIKRRKEHMGDIKRGNQTTALARLNLKENIQVNFNDSKIIFHSNKYYPSIIRESIEIITRKSTVCNESTSFNLANLWVELFLKTGHERSSGSSGNPERALPRLT